MAARGSLRRSVLFNSFAGPTNPRHQIFVRRPSAQFVLGAAAIFAFLWVFARACLQSITIDEADTYLFFVGRPWPSHWEPSTNNHLLNSLLMRLFTSLFGVSHLSVRAPALIGAAIYIAATYALCRR